ncbi:MAG: ASKHA domain-containing protein, partial [Spirochaetaceae bacterium]|nr:ASKHA domain-containing protein [Spirochaetaceae bacterium]
MSITLENIPAGVEPEPGESVLSALARAGFALTAPCGGRGVCGKCRVKLLSGGLLGGGPDDSGEFLACRGIPAGDISIAFLRDEGFVENEAAPSHEPLDETPAGGAAARSRITRAGAALDIGTTTLSARLVDMDTLRPIATFSALNDQRVLGADVITRIQAARNGRTGELYNLINRQTERILRLFIEKYCLDKIETLMVSGNTTMLHLFTNTDPSPMGEVPFTPVFLERKELRGPELALPADRITLLPSIAAYVGSDIVSGLAFLDVLGEEKPGILIDIGTNGEMALYNRGQILCCSTAAGPAFEGAEISCGIGSVRGAINKVEMNEGRPGFTTIGGAPVRGICGSGLIDAIAVMLDEGIIEESGAFSDDHCREFAITEGITLTNRDVRQVQLAKSAIMSGIKL